MEYGGLKEKLDQDVSCLALNDIVKPRVLDEKKEEDVKTRLVFFEAVPEEVHNILKPLGKIQGSNVFLKEWERSGKRVRRENRALSLEQVAKDVWEDALQRAQTVYEKLRSGTIPLRQVSRLIKDCGSAEMTKKEMRILSGGGNMGWIEERFEQVDRYRRLKEFHRGAEAVLMAAKTLKLTGDFSTLSDIVDVVSYCSFASF